MYRPSHLLALSVSLCPAFVACLGDLDEDGRDDFAIASPRHGRAGAVYLFHGRARGDWTQPTGIGVERADAVLEGVLAHGAFGSYVARVGDVSGDGRADLAIAAPNADLGAQDGGAVYLVFGRRERLAGRAPISAMVGASDAISPAR